MKRTPLLLFCWLLGCGGGEAPPAAGPPAAAPSTAAAPASAEAKSEPPRSLDSRPRPSAPAPVREVLGLRLGEVDEAGLLAWASARGLQCPGTTAPRRATTRHVCQAADLAAALPERPVKGRHELLAVTRLDAGPVHDLTMRALYSAPADAAADYNAAVAALTATLGPPERSSAAPAEPDASKPMLWYSTTWRFADLDVSVALLRAGGPSWGVTERWQLPGVEANAPERPGSSPIHGGGVPKSTNPHAITTP